MALSFTSNHEKMAFEKSDNYSRLVKAVAPALEFNLLGVSTVGTGGVASRNLHFSDLAGIITWCQQPANIAALITFLSNPTGPQSNQYNWTGTSIDLVNSLGFLPGNVSSWVDGSGSFGSGWWGFGSDAFSSQPIYTDAYWTASGSPPTVPHGIAALTGGNAFVGILAMSIGNTAWTYSAGSYYWLPGLSFASQNNWGTKYQSLVPSTNRGANVWALMPMPNLDTSIVNNTAIPTGTSPSRYLVPGLMSLPIVPLIPGLSYAG